MQHDPISRARYMQENRKMRFQEAYDGWNEGRLTQAEAALLLGQCERSFRRHIERASCVIGNRCDKKNQSTFTTNSKRRFMNVMQT
jgi:hypothetical protein